MTTGFVKIEIVANFLRKYYLVRTIISVSKFLGKILYCSIAFLLKMSHTKVEPHIMHFKTLIPTNFAVRHIGKEIFSKNQNESEELTVF